MGRPTVDPEQHSQLEGSPGSLHLDAEGGGDGVHVLVASAAQVHDDQVVRGDLGAHLQHLRDGVRGLQRGNDAFEA